MTFALMLLPLAVLPLFICLPNGEIPILHLFGYSIQRDSVNLCLNVVHCVFGFVLFFCKPLDRQLAYFMFFSFVWLFASLLSGLYVEYDPTNMAFFIQTVLPIFAIPYGYYLIQRENDLEKVIRLSTRATAFFLVTLTLVIMWRYGPISLITDRMRVMQDVELAIPQFKSYYPVAVQFTFSLALAQYLFGTSANSRSVFVLLLAHGLFIPLCWSRAGLLGIAFSAAIQFMIAAKLRRSTYYQRAAAIMAAFGLVLPLLFSHMGSTVSSRTEVAEIGNDSDHRRLEVFIEGTQRVCERPLFGDMFIPCWDERVGGEDVDVKRLFGAHNQYVDFALRGGFIYLGVILIMLYLTYSKARFLTRQNGVAQKPEYLVIGAAACSYIVATLVSSNFQLYLIQLQTAAPFYVMMGITFRVWRLAKHQSMTTKTRLHTAGLRMPMTQPATPGVWGARTTNGFSTR